MTDIPPTLTKAQLAQCPAMDRSMFHWREDGTCLHYPEGFDFATAPECGARQMGGTAVCKLKVPGDHAHFWWPDDTDPMRGGVRWQTQSINMGGHS